MAVLSHHMGYAMVSLGFSGKPSEWVGKTIEAVETVRMEFGAVSDNATLFRFTDGTRGWTVGRGSAQGIVTGPSVDALATSAIVTPEEYGWIMEAQKRESDRRAADRLADKKRQLERLQREIEGKS